MKEKFLLHVCCAPCAAYVIELLKERFNLSLYFYNPNIQPISEYQKRLAELKKHAIKLGYKSIEGQYHLDKWQNMVLGQENDQEGGKRCKICYKMRLEATARLAKERGIEWFGTTLTISPHKDALAINQIGRELADRHGLSFYEADFKKQNGFKKTMQLACQHGFYRQDYCGCVYSQAN